MENTTLDDLYNELKLIHRSMVTKEEIARLVETIVILTNSDTMRQIEESEKDILAGRVKRINSIADL